MFDKTVEKLVKIVKKTPVDWDTFDAMLSKVADINILDDRLSDTILSDLIRYAGVHHYGPIMGEITRRFLSKGYDVHANGGKNGVIPLCALAWSTYDENIIDVVKALLDAGSPLEYRSEEDYDERSVDGAIDWRLPGAWGPDCDYECANVFEAYYEIVEAYRQGKDYNNIDSYHKCIGLPLTKVEYIGDSLKKQKETTEFYGSFVMWFGDCPLIVRRWIDAVVNSVFVDENKEHFSDVSDCFKQLLGAKLERIEYANAITCYFDFDNGYRLLFSNYEDDKEESNGLFEIRRAGCLSFKDCKVLEIFGESGVSFAADTTIYNERILVLKGENEGRCIYPIDDGSRHLSIGGFPCSMELLRDNNRKYLASEIRGVIEYKRKGKLSGLRIRCKEGYFYVVADWRGLKVTLSTKRFNPNNDRDWYEED